MYFSNDSAVINTQFINSFLEYNIFKYEIITCIYDTCEIQAPHEMLLWASFAPRSLFQYQGSRGKFSSTGTFRKISNDTRLHTYTYH